MVLEYEFTFNTISTKDIEKVENEYGLTLPESYKKFLLLQNGGKPVKRRFKTADEIITSSVMLFLPISKETEENFKKYYNKYCLNKIVPSNFIPIGIDPADNLICLTLGEKSKVYYCDMDYFEEDNELKDEFISLVSEDFSTFLHNLYEAK